MCIKNEKHCIENDECCSLEKARDALVLLAPGEAPAGEAPAGEAFSTTEGPSRYARAAFSIASDETIDESLRRFGQVLQDVKAENGLVVAPEAALAPSGQGDD